MVEYMFDLREASGRDAARCTDPLGRVHQVRLHPSDREDGAGSSPNHIAALRVAGGVDGSGDSPEPRIRTRCG